MSVGTTETPVTVSAPMPLLKRVFKMFFSPRPVFESLRAHPKWLDVLLIGIVAGLLVYLPMSGIIKDMSFERAQEQIEKVDGLSAEQREQAVERQRTFFNSPAFQALSIGGGIAGPVVILLVYALLFVLGYGFLLGGQIKFKQAFAAACHLNLIFVLAGLVKLPLVLARKSVEVATSLALVLPATESKSIPYAVLDTFDIFTLWALVVMVGGMAAMTGVPKGKSWTFGVILLLLVMGIRVLGALMGGMG